MGDFNIVLINAKYHLVVAERMYQGYKEFTDKRFLIGVINELAKAVSNLVKAFLVYENLGGKNAQKNMRIFMNTVAPKYLDALARENLFKVLEIERAQKISPIEYAKDEKIILLIHGKYRFLTATRVGEFIKSVKESVADFPRNFRQI